MMALCAPIDLNYSKLNYTAMKHFNLLKTTLLLCALVVGSLSSWADTSIVTASKVSNTSETWTGSAGESWSVVVSGGAVAQNVTNSYAQIGTGANPSTSVTFSTSGISGTITSIVVNCASKSGSAKANVTVGGDAFGTQNQSTPSWSSSKGGNVTFSGNASGEIVVTLSGSSGATYIKSITVTYTSSGGSVNTVDVPTFSPVAGAITAGTTITLTQATADEIRYTLNGTNPTKTTGTVYSNPIEITTATTIKAIAVEDGDVSSVATAAYTIDVATPTFSPESGSYLVGSTFSMSASGNKIYYNLTTDGSEPANPTTSSTEYTTPIDISGTTKIKAIAVDVYGNSSSVVTRTYTGITPATLPFSWSGTSSKGKSDLEGKTGVKLSLGSDYATSNAPYRLKFDDKGKYVTIFTDVKPYLVSFSAKLFNATTTGSKLTVQESVDGKEFSDVEEFTINGSANSTFSFTTTNSFDTNTRVVRLVLSEKDQNVGVGTIVVTKAEPITISAAGWATYCSSNALDFTGVTALTAYTATKEGSVVKFNKVTGKVPANTGLLVRGETANVPVCASADPVTNLLVGVTAETTKDAGTVFVLMKGASGIGFYKNTNAFTLRANSAYLPAEAVPTADARAFIALDDETTGIADVRSLKDNTESMFDLQGRKIAKPAKGLYIVNGKKVVVK